MSSVEIKEQDEEKKLPLHLWDKKNLKSTFQNSSMDIFHINEVRLIDLQSQLNSSKITLKPKQIAVKIYTIFEDMNIIFQRLGLSELYHQLRLILNMICKFSLFSEQNKKKEQLKVKKQEKNPDEQSNSIQKLVLNQKDFDRLKLKRKYNRLAGIFLYNESYIKTIQKTKKDQERCKKDFSNIKQLLDPEDKNQELQRLQMIYYLDRKKELAVLKIKDNTKKYQEIQDDFRGVQLKLKQMVDNLELQFQSQYQKSYNYLSKEQINAQLMSFNMNMRAQVVLLKQQCNNVAQSLRQQNIELKNQLDEWLFRKNSMVSTKVQTVQTIASLNKTKKMADDYQRKVNILQNKIEDCLKKNDQIQENFNSFAAKKNKQLASFEEFLNNKQQVIETLRNRCQNYSQIINSQSNIIKSLQFSDEQTKQKIMDQLTKKMLDQQKQDIQKKPRNRNSFLSRLGGQRSPIRSLSKHSRFSASTSQFDQMGDRIQNAYQQMIKNETNENFYEKNQQKIVEKKYSESVWRKNNYKFLNTFSKRNRRSVIVKNRLDRRFDNREISTLKSNFNYESSLNTSQERGMLKNKNTVQLGINKKSERGSQKNSHNSSFRNEICHLQIKQKNKNKDSESTRRVNNKQQLKENNDKDNFLVIADGKMKKYSSFPCNLIQNEAQQPSDREIKKLKSRKKIETRFNQCRQGLNLQKQIKSTLQKKRKKTKFQQNKQNNEIPKVSMKNLKSTKEFFAKSSKKLGFTSNQQNFIHQQNIIYESQKQNVKTKKTKREEQVLQQLLNHKTLTMNSFKQILSDYPKIYQKLISERKNEKMIKYITQTHTLTCKEKSCNHLQAFFQFCKKLAEEPSKRKVLNVHIQKF